MGVLPRGSVAAAVDAVGLVQRTEGLRGVVSGTKICGMALDDPAPEPLWSALSGGGTPLLVLPHHGVGLDEMDGFGHALPRALRAAADLAGTDRMVFGTGHPFAIADPAVNIAAIADTFGSSERRLVPAENAQGMGLPVLVEEPA